MSKTSLIGSCEVTINSALKRLSILKGKDKIALENEFREWIDAIKSIDKDYDIFFINEIN